MYAAIDKPDIGADHSVLRKEDYWKIAVWAA
jgi:hypothetical protein